MELLLAAATTEFAQYGLAGARIDRIAERAGANKRLLYVYFGDKDELFTAVLKHQVGKLAEETPLVDGDLVTYAGTRFDYLLTHPETARLAAVAGPTGRMRARLRATSRCRAPVAACGARPLLRAACSARSDHLER
ncbi:TetR/AcrR family transcriptional regulator [Streptomyces sp. 900116325]